MKVELVYDFDKAERDAIRRHLGVTKKLSRVELHRWMEMTLLLALEDIVTELGAEDPATREIAEQE